jgi:hypothetical protein
MNVRRTTWLAVLSLSVLSLPLLFLPLLACDNTPNNPAGFVFIVDSGGPVDHSMTDGSGLTDGGYQCSWPAALDNGGSIPGCGTGRAFVTCTESGGSVSYPTSQAMGCPACNGTCTELCNLNEFALSCANPVSDAATSSPGLPHGCHLAQSFPTGSVAYCCPCE